MSREKSEQLLACFEGIDDDIIAEAAAAVATRPTRQFPWISMAASLVGIIAVTCIVAMAIWLGSAGQDHVPAGDANDEYNYADDPEGNIPLTEWATAVSLEMYNEMGRDHIIQNAPENTHVEIIIILSWLDFITDEQFQIVRDYLGIEPGGFDDQIFLRYIMDDMTRHYLVHYDRIPFEEMPDNPRRILTRMYEAWMLVHIEYRAEFGDGFIETRYVHELERDVYDWRAVLPYSELTEPREAPTGARALPEDVFRVVEDYHEFWRPLIVQREMVAELWQEVLEDIGGLGVDQAYQFRTACGRYAKITGAQTIDPVGLAHYYPGIRLPETVGDFILREVFVYDRSNIMLVYERPMPMFDGFFVVPPDAPPAPVGQVYTRPLVFPDGTPLVYAFAAMYENSDGLQVGLGASPGFGRGLPYSMFSHHEVIAMGEFGDIYFQTGEDANNGFYRALLSTAEGLAVELWFIGAPVSERRGMLDLMLVPDSVGFDAEMVLRGSEKFLPVTRQELEELVGIFDPARLAREFDWQMVSWQ